MFPTFLFLLGHLIFLVRIVVAYEVNFPPRPSHTPTMGQILITESISFPNTATAGGYIEVFMTVSDSVSDICGGYGIKMHYISTGWSPCTGDFKLYNGTTKEGTWLATCFLPEDAENGDYSLEVHMHDEEGNNNNPQSYDGPITVSGGTVPDTTAPFMQDLNYNNDHVYPGDTLIVNIHANDSQSGVSKMTYGMYDMYSSSDSLCKGDFVLVSGDIFDGQWQYECVIPEDAPISIYDGKVNAYDNKGNKALETRTVYVDYHQQ